MATSSSSESDEENINKFREAAIDCHQFICPGAAVSGRKSEHGPYKGQKSIDLPSFRPLHDTKLEDAELQTTPEFKQHIAKKLTAFIDSEVEEVTPTEQMDVASEEPDSGIRLFLSSKNYICDKTDDEKRLRPQRKNRVSSSSDSSEDERLAEAAVSHDFVMQQSHTCTTNSDGNSRSSGDIIQSNDIARQTGLQNSSAEKLFNQDCQEKCSKHKKKKKKKKREIETFLDSTQEWFVQVKKKKKDIKIVGEIKVS